MIRFEESEVHSVTVMKVAGSRIAADTAAPFRSQIIERVNAGVTGLVLDLGNVSFIDSSGLGALVSILKAAGNGGKLAVCGVQGAVAAAFRLSRMDRVLRIYGDVETAVDALTPVAV